MGILLLTTRALAADLFVDTSGSAGTYGTIAEAVDAATDGDTIVVAAGSWYECVDFGGKTLALEGAGSTSTAIDAFGVCEPVLDLSGAGTASVSGVMLSNPDHDGVVISGGTITFDDVAITDVGDGESGSPLTIDGATVSISSGQFDTLSGSSWEDVVIADSDVIVQDSEWADVEILHDGGSLALSRNTFSGCRLDVIDSIFSSEDNGYESTPIALEYLTGTLQGDAFTTGAGYSCTLAPRGATVTLNALSFTGCAVALGPYAASIVTVSDSEFHLNTGTNGAAIDVSTSTVETTRCIFEGNESDESGGAIYVDPDSSYSDEGSTFVDNWAEYGGAIYSEADLSLSGSTFSGNRGYPFGTAIYATPQNYSDPNLQVALSDCSVTDGLGNSGAVYLEAVDAVIDGCTFSGHTTSAIEFSRGSLSVTSSTFESNSVSFGSGGGILFGLGTLEVADSVFTDNSVDEDGAGIYADGASGQVAEVSLSGVGFYDNAAGEDGGGAYFGNYVTVTADDVWAIGNSAGGTGGGLKSVGTLTNAFVCGNTADSVGGVSASTLRSSIVARNVASTSTGGASATTVTNVTFAYNEAPLAGALQAGGTITNTIVAYTLDGYGVYVGSDVSIPTTYTNFFDNLPGDSGGYYEYAIGGFGNANDDPLFVHAEESGDCWTDSYVLASGSTLRDAGDPDLLDPDGTRSDIGGVGGPSSAWADADGDEWLDGWDCDDGDAALHPEAEETCNSLDDDCDGEADEDATDAGTWYADADGDGFGNAEAGQAACGQPEEYVENAEDCDDGDSRVHPGAAEVAGDEIDQDCDGSDAAEPVDTGETDGGEDTSGSRPEDTGSGETGSGGERDEASTEDGCGCGTGDLGRSASLVGALATALFAWGRRRPERLRP